MAQSRTPATGAALAIEDLQSLPTDIQPFIRYLWCPAGSLEEHQAAAVSLNCSINQGSTEVVPQIVANGALVRVDLRQCCDDEKQLIHLTRLWDGLAAHDPIFHYTVTNEIKGDKKTAAHKETVIAPAPHLGKLNFRVGLCYRIDQFVAITLSSVDGGQYLAFRGLQPGVTKLDDYLSSRGFSLKAAEKNNTLDQLVMLSQITGKVRVVKMIHGSGTKPSVGRPLATITEDVADGTIDPNANSFLSLLNEKFAAEEVIVTMASGHQEFTLFDGSGKLLAEAAPNVAADHTVPPPFPPRLQEALSCISCHGPSSGYQTIQNEVATIVHGTGRILADLSKGVDPSKQFQALRTIQSRYGATQHDIDAAIADARDGLDRRYDAVAAPKTEHAAKESYAATAAIGHRYLHRWLTPAIACEELGIEPGKAPVAALRAALPAVSATGSVAEGSAGISARLQAGLNVTRVEWEPAYVELQTKAMASIEQTASVQKENVK